MKKIFSTESFSLQLQRALDYKRMSQSELARRVNKPRAQINHWYTGVSVPRKRNIAEILDVLPGISIVESEGDEGLYNLIISDERSELYEDYPYRGVFIKEDDAANAIKNMVKTSLLNSIKSLNDAITDNHHLPQNAKQIFNTSKLMSAHFLIGSVLENEYDKEYSRPPVRQDVTTISYEAPNTDKE